MSIPSTRELYAFSCALPRLRTIPSLRSPSFSCLRASPPRTLPLSFWPCTLHHRCLIRTLTLQLSRDPARTLVSMYITYIYLAHIHFGVIFGLIQLAVYKHATEGEQSGRKTTHGSKVIVTGILRTHHVGFDLYMVETRPTTDHQRTQTRRPQYHR